VARVLSRSFRPRGPRRQTDWALGLVSSAYVNIPAASKVLITRFTAAQMAAVAPGTIVRVRGMLSIKSDQVAAREEFQGAVGLGFVNETAGALGVTGIPGPCGGGAGEVLYDGWLYHQFFQQMFELGTAVGFDSQGSTNYVIDSKAMRKFDGDVSLVFIAQNINAANGFDLSAQFRILVKAG